MTRIRLFLFIIAILAPSLAAAQQSMKFEEAAAMLAASCGKDIDDNCRGVNLDATRLKECLGRNQDVVSAKCKTDYPLGPRRHPAAHYRAHLTCKTVQLGVETSVRRGPGGSGQGSAMSVGLHQEGDPELQQGDQRCGVSLMPGVNRAARHRSRAGRPGPVCLADGGGAGANGRVQRRYHREACR